MYFLPGDQNLNKDDDETELEEVISHLYNIASRSRDVKQIEEHIKLQLWLTELQERRKVGYVPPCWSCERESNCIVTSKGNMARSWRCQFYEHTTKKEDKYCECYISIPEKGK